VEDWRQQRLNEAGELFEALSKVTQAVEFVRRVRSDGGVDHYFAEQEQLTPHDRTELDALEAIERQAAGLIVTDPNNVLESEEKLLREYHDREKGIELRTIHGAKGAEWPMVVVFGFEEGQLPHARSTADVESEDDELEALEDERRLAYVACTRPMERLVLLVR